MARKTRTLRPTVARGVPVMTSPNDLLSVYGMAEMAGVTPQQVITAVKSGNAQGTLSPHDGTYWFTPYQRQTVMAAFPTP